MQDCIFCKIARHEMPSEVVYENDRVIVFKDINPVAPVHVLLVPKKHIRDLTAVGPEDKDLLGELNLVAVDVARKLGVYESGFRLVNNCGEDSGQVVPHIHYHLIGGRKLGRLG
ncbi:MAG: histidine triad nucleotide-binding protein [Clostridia bacterium]|nr:histidine triad nucleotide-binding protein [Clostridia bacterium]